MIKEYEFKPSQIKNGECLFPEQISADSWVVYHGTSSLNEESIDENGLRWNQSTYSKDDIQKILDIYEKIDWSGTDQGGYMVLKSYTMDYDFKSSDKKSIFLAESSIRALLYATSDFAGGETARAIRKSINDLQEYIELKSIRDDHMEYRRNEYKQSLNHLHTLNKPQEVDLKLLKKNIDSVTSIFKVNKVLSDKHEYGLIYAVKIFKEDIEFLEYNWMGVILNKALSSSRLIGKIKIPKEYIYELYEDKKRRIDTVINPKGLYLELKKVGKL